MKLKIPQWLRWYKKPEYRDIREYSTAISSGKRSLSPDGRGRFSIPRSLALDRILQNKTCSPMSLYDFYMYLKYIEFSAENLEFYIWFCNYEATWAKMLDAEKHGDKDDVSFHSSSDSASSVVKPEKIAPITALKDDRDPENVNDTLSRIAELISADTRCVANSCGPTFGERVKAIVGTGGDAAKTIAAPKISPSSHAAVYQRAELSTVIETFLAVGSEKELNVPPLLRTAALRALRTSQDPAHLRPIADHVYGLLRNCSHRNFVRLGVSNGTFETICVATSLGIVLTCAGFLCVMLRAFTPYMGSHSRWESFAPWPMWWLGLSLILSGLRGSCFFLLLFTRRQPLPWERFDDNQSVLSNKSGIIKLLSRLMIFDRKLTVKDENLRRLQHKIVWQSLIGGAVFATLGVVLFIFLPIWAETVKR